MEEISESQAYPHQVYKQDIICCCFCFENKQDKVNIVALNRPKKYNFTEALQKLRRYCAYQERCHQEIRNKLWEWGFGSEDMDKAAVQLMEEGFLNEERFAKAVVGGKFRQKGWGKRRIVESLKQKGISPTLVNSSLKEINPEDYRNKLLELLEKKAHSLRAELPTARKQKLARYAIGKGYEQELVWELLKSMEGGIEPEN
jgi:regulatory protein